MARIIYGKRAISEALRHSPDQITRLLLEKSKLSALSDIASLANECGTAFEWVSRDQIDKLSQTPKHQGVVALLRDFAYTSVKDFLSRLPNGRRVVVALDGVTDPQNLGACLRSAGAFGASLVVITKDRSATINATVAKASAGATEVVPVARETNLVRALELLKKANFWVFGLDVNGDAFLAEQDLTGDIVLVLGSEGEGMRRLTAENCDRLLRLPNPGPIESLNVAQACAVALYEVNRLL